MTSIIIYTSAALVLGCILSYVGLRAKYELLGTSHSQTAKELLIYCRDLKQTILNLESYREQYYDIQGRYEEVQVQLNQYSQSELVSKSDYEPKLLALATECSEWEHKYAEIQEKNENLVSHMRSSQVKLGHVSENLLPFLADFPYDSKKVRGLYNPIDLIVFEDDAIILIEIKSGESHLSSKQKNIKKLVDEGKVRFEIHRLSEVGYEKN